MNFWDLYAGQQQQASVPNKPRYGSRRSYTPQPAVQPAAPPVQAQPTSWMADLNAQHGPAPEAAPPTQADLDAQAAAEAEAAARRAQYAPPGPENNYGGMGWQAYLNQQNGPAPAPAAPTEQELFAQSQEEAAAAARRAQYMPQPKGGDPSGGMARTADFQDYNGNGTDDRDESGYGTPGFDQGRFAPGWLDQRAIGADPQGYNQWLADRQNSQPPVPEYARGQLADLSGRMHGGFTPGATSQQGLDSGYANYLGQQSFVAGGPGKGGGIRGGGFGQDQAGTGNSTGSEAWWMNPGKGGGANTGNTGNTGGFGQSGYRGAYGGSGGKGGR
jgi:hypothetical protein